MTHIQAGNTLLGLLAGLTITSGDTSTFIIKNSHILPRISNFWKILEEFDIQDALVSSLRDALENYIEDSIDKPEELAKLKTDEGYILEEFVKQVILDQVFYDCILK